MAIYSKHELTVKYNEVLNSYVSRGFIVYPFVLARGRCGDEVTHTDLFNSKDRKFVYRLWMAKNYRWDSFSGRQVDELHITVKKYPLKFASDRSNCLWYDEGEYISDETFFQVKENNSYTDSLDQLNEIRTLREKRKELKRNSENKFVPHKIDICRIPANLIDVIMYKVNRVRGFKRATASCLKSLTMHKYCNSWGRNGRLYADVEFSFDGKSGSIRLG